MLKHGWRWFALALGIAAADQLTKWLVLTRFTPGERLEVTGFFNLVLAFNKGAAFSFLAAESGWQAPALALFSLVAAIVVSVMIVRSPGRRLLCMALTLVLGGAVGNLVDRVRLGYVVDFLDFHAAGWHFAAFNLADSAISVGAVLLILESFVGGKKNSGEYP